MITQSTMPQPIPLRFKVDDYYKMIELGILEDYEKAEIIEGELIRKMPIGDKHAFVVDTLNRFFVKMFPMMFWFGFKIRFVYLILMSLSLILFWQT